MPPRKRAPNAPKTDGTKETQEPLTDEGSQEPAPDPDTATPSDPKPEKSDLQPVETPCAQCFPTGWPAQSFSVGCEHGTWTRKSAT